MKNSMEYLLKLTAFSPTEKVVKEGRVAVIISNNHIGWYTNGKGKKELLFDPKIVQFYKDKDMLGLIEYVRNTYPGVYVDELTNLDLRWVREGSLFRVQRENIKSTAFDKAESLEIFDELDWMVA